MRLQPQGQQGMREVKDSVEKASGDIDIFLTAAWPAGITQGTAPNALPAGAELPGQPPVLHPSIEAIIRLESIDLLLTLSKGKMQWGIISQAAPYAANWQCFARD